MLTNYASSRCQPGEGPSRGLLHDYEPSDGPFWSTDSEAGGEVAWGHGDPPQYAGHIMEEVKSDSELQAQYIPKNPVSRVIQCAAVQSENEVTYFDPL